MSNKVFAAFDDRKGPVPVYSTLTDRDLASKIAVKSIVSTLSARQTNEKVEGEAIIPFPDENLLAFIYYVSLDQKTETGDNRIISLTYLVATEESGSLYANAELLSKNAKNIGETINKHYVYGDPVSQYIQAKINHWDQSDKKKLEIIQPKQQLEGKHNRKVNLYD